MKPDLFWIPGPWPGRLAVSTRPRGGDWLEDESAGWRGAGLDVVVSLLEPDEAAQLGLENEGSVAESSGLRFIAYPIPDRGVPSSTPEALAFLRELIAELAAGRNVAIHCRQGVGRSGMVAVAALMMAGAGTRQSLEAVSHARGVAVPETASQRQWLESVSSERMSLAL
jgi:protein-tyrosine phosphatase